MAALDLAGYRTAVQEDLDDTGAAVWTTTEIDRAIKRALREYSRHHPYRLDTVVTLSAAGREVDLASLTDLRGVERVWWDYDSSDPGDLPDWCEFEMRLGQKLFLFTEAEPESGDKIRVYWWRYHTIKDLDSATATTVPADDEEVIICGAAGYAAMEKARSAVGAINVSGYTPVHWRDWARGRLDEFEAMLAGVRVSSGVMASGPVAMG